MNCNLLCADSFLVYALSPNSFTTNIMCETCYAKTYFRNEFPNLSQLSLDHIKMLPHVSNSTTQSGVIRSFGQIPQFNQIPLFSGSSATGQFDWPFGVNSISNTPHITNAPSAPLVPHAAHAPISFGGFQLPRSGNTEKPHEIRKQKQPKRTDSTAPITRQSSVPYSLPQQQSSTSPQSSTYNPEIAKRINEFIKRTLLPELMDFPDPTPNNKHPRVDTEEETQTDDDTTDWPFEWIGGDVKNIRDLIRIGKEYKDHPKRVQTNLDLVKLCMLVEPLETLQNMVGLDEIKDSIFKQVVFHLQDLDNGNKDMHHTVINGPPGVGKTQISHIIAKIYNGLGFLKKDTVVSVKRDDLIAGYLGQTAMKAKKKYEEALGGVLLIDEAYALGDGSDKDSYSKEAIDLLTSYLSEHGHEFICIIAGYKEALEKRFFSVNEGLARRFNIHYDIKPYSGTDVCQIFQKLVADGGWQLDASAYNPEFFVEHLDSFPHFGGDMQNLFAYTKKAHSSRLLAIRTKEQLMNTKKKINMADLESGFEQYKAGNGYATKDTTPFEAKFMYM